LEPNFLDPNFSKPNFLDLKFLDPNFLEPRLKSSETQICSSCLLLKYFKSRLFPYAGGSPPCTPRRSAGGRPIGQEISKIRGGNMKQNPLKCRGLWVVRE
jgi:hypothetical protein